MKKIVFGLGGLIFASQVSAAAVTIDGIGGTYTTDGQTYMNLGTTYEVFLKSALADPQVDNAGEELIYLGAHTGIGTSAGTGTISVNLNSQNNQLTGPVSLVLSASSSTIWDFTVDLSKVQINNIFVIASELDQTIRFGGTTIDMGLGDVDSFSGINIERLDFQACGYEYPSSGVSCNTDEVIGIESENNPFDDNFLNDELTDLLVTDFAGTYFVEAFNITVDSVVIPLPAAAYLFGSALAAGAALRRKL